MSEQQQVGLSDLSVEQLKALAYDQIVMVNRGQQAIAALEGEIQRRANEAELEATRKQAEAAREQAAKALEQGTELLQAGLDCMGGRHKVADVEPELAAKLGLKQDDKPLPRGPMIPSVTQEL